jgi:hypothetical protein
VLYLRDRDELSSAALDRLAAISVVYVLRRRELENYLLGANAVAAAIVDRGFPQATLVDAEAVEETLREGADRLKPVVILKRIVGELVSRRLVDRTLVADLVQQGVTLERFRAAVAERLPSEQLLDEITKRWVAMLSRRTLRASGRSGGGSLRPDLTCWPTCGALTAAATTSCMMASPSPEA